MPCCTLASTRPLEDSRLEQVAGLLTLGEHCIPAIQRSAHALAAKRNSDSYAKQVPTSGTTGEEPEAISGTDLDDDLYLDQVNFPRAPMAEQTLEPHPLQITRANNLRLLILLQYKQLRLLLDTPTLG